MRRRAPGAESVTYDVLQHTRAGERKLLENSNTLGSIPSVGAGVLEGVPALLVSVHIQRKLATASNVQITARTSEI
jgi:hypothetical protein